MKLRTIGYQLVRGLACGGSETIEITADLARHGDPEGEVKEFLSIVESTVNPNLGMKWQEITKEYD